MTWSVILRRVVACEASDNQVEESYSSKISTTQFTDGRGLTADSWL